MNNRFSSATRPFPATIVVAATAITILVTGACSSSEGSHRLSLPGVFPSAADAPGGPPGGPAAGVLPDDGVAVDSTLPGVARLSPDLRSAVRKAAADARLRGLEMRITSGWRSRAYQEQLFDTAVERYGSVTEASRLVARPSKSKHVTGDAVDIGPTDAADWLIRNGSEYGLCQIFANEMWHFELVPSGRCPDLLPDAGHL